ncbi:helix-hairpin-helix domain-containing protein [Streptococcus fryi]
MGSKVTQGRKRLRQELRRLKRQGQVVADKALTKAEVVVTQVAEQAQVMVEAVQEQVSKVSFEAFSSLSEFESLPEARLKNFYDEGIQSISDFTNWTEQELLALKGIGPATIKTLKENGVVFKD